MDLDQLKQRFDIKLYDPKDLTPNPHNHRRHPEAQRHALIKAIEEDGWLEPAIFNIRTGRLVDGHLRREVAIERGEQVPTIEIEVDAKTERKIMARHDRIGALAEIDDGTLGIELAYLESNDIDLVDLGWDETTPASDHKPELREVPVKKPVKMAWVLIGIPIEKYDRVAQTIENLAESEGVILETSVS